MNKINLLIILISINYVCGLPISEKKNPESGEAIANNAEKPMIDIDPETGKPFPARKKLTDVVKDGPLDPESRKALPSLMKGVNAYQNERLPPPENTKNYEVKDIAKLLKAEEEGHGEEKENKVISTGIDMSGLSDEAKALLTNQKVNLKEENKSVKETGTESKSDLQ